MSLKKLGLAGIVLGVTIIALTALSGCDLLGEEDDKKPVSLEPSLEGLKPISNGSAVLVTDPAEALVFFSGAIGNVADYIELQIETQYSVTIREALQSLQGTRSSIGASLSPSALQPSEAYDERYPWDATIDGPLGGTAHTRGIERESGSYSQTPETPPYTATLRMNSYFDDTTDFTDYRWSWTSGGAPAEVHQINGRVYTRFNFDINVSFTVDSGENVTGGEIVLSGGTVLSAAVALEPVSGTGKAGRGLVYVSAGLSGTIVVDQALLDMIESDSADASLMDNIDLTVNGYIHLYNNANERVGTKTLTQADLETILGDIGS